MDTIRVFRLFSAIILLIGSGEGSIPISLIDLPPVTLSPGTNPTTELQTEAPNNLPADIPRDWWGVADQDIRQSEYHIIWQEQTYLPDASAAYQAPNRAHNLRTYFTLAGVRLIPRQFDGQAPPWQLGIKLTGYGYHDQVQPVSGPAQLAADGNRFEYRYPSVITEWYINDERGLEQGFTLQSPPKGNATGEIVLELALTGNLVAQLIDEGRAIEFATSSVTGSAQPGGVTVLRYGELLAYDAAGLSLPARLELISLPLSNELRELPGLRVVIDAASARFPITVDPLATTPDWTAEGNQSGASFGHYVSTAGDVNNDGFDDVIIGAYQYDNGEADEGRAFVYLGSAAGLSTAPDWIAESNQAGAWFGHMVGTAGDVNGDGFDDVIVGAHCYDNGQTDEGRAFVYYGSSAGLSLTPDWTAEGDQENAYFGGYGGAAGDVNGDGFSDVILGAYGYDNGEGDEGRVYVYHGSVAGLSLTPDWFAESDQAGAYFGWSVGAAGDVNGDGFDDVIVGARYYDNGEYNEGRAFVYLGSAAGLGVSPSWTAESDQENAYFGASVGTAGDVNGDGFDDVIVGAYDYDGGDGYDPNLFPNEGRAFVYHGSSVGLSLTPDWTADPCNQAWARFGRWVATAGDVNGDGFSDVIIGAYQFDDDYTDEGRAYVYTGSTTGLGTTPKWTANGDQNDASLGWSVGTAGDVNGDGFDDLIVGAYQYSNGHPDEGRAYIYYGSESDSELELIFDWTTRSNQENAAFGISVGTAGDVNGDGFDDVIVGAYRYDNGQADEGRAFVYSGSVSGLSITPTWTAESNQEMAFFGVSVGAAGDVNGDGFSDVIVGAESFDNDQANEGRAFVYYGSASGLTITPTWTAESDLADAYFGHAVGAAGDVNGDGFGDVIVGAYGYDGDWMDEGRAYVYHGSASGLSAVPDWVAEGDQEMAWFGYSVSRAGDVNADGFEDAIVGAPNDQNGGAGGGGAFVYYGSVSGLSTTPDWITVSDQAGASFGASVSAAGDVNGDGFGDVIIGASGFDLNRIDEGRAFVYHGSASGLSIIPDWTVEGHQAYANFGGSVDAAGDINGDGYSDVIIGAESYDNGQVDSGSAFVYQGSILGLRLIPDWTAESEQALAHLGNSVGTAGDVNGDGFDDVIVGALYYDMAHIDEGAASVYHGSASGLGDSASWAATGSREYAQFGHSVSTAGDINGDGFDDVIIGAPGYDNGEAGEGRAFAYYGSASGLSTIADWSAESDQAGANLGASVSTAGDVNGDGFDDVIIGAPGYDTGQADAGCVFVFYGSVDGLSPTPDWLAEGNQSGASFGSSTGAAGDVNGDGFGDVIIGAPGYDNGEADEGRAFAYYGSASGLSTAADWSAESDQAGAIFSASVSTAGDVNGDGFGDVIIGAERYDNGHTEWGDEGRAFVYHGSAAGLSASPDWLADGDQFEAFFGHAVGAAGDVNNDGFGDVIIGETYYSNGQNFEGRVLVYHGSISGLPLEPDWTAEGDQSDSYFGWSVGSAGDVNGDGFGDVLVGAYGYDSFREGRAFMYYGSEAGLSLNPNWTTKIDQDNAHFGWFVSTAGDVNADGFSDVLVSAKNYDRFYTNEGCVFAYHGSSVGLRAYGLPIAVNDRYATGEDVTLIVHPLGLLANDSEALAAFLDTAPAHGVLQFNPDGSFTYIPMPGYTGIDNFTYHINDGENSSNTATVAITVRAPPRSMVYLPLVTR